MTELMNIVQMARELNIDVSKIERYAQKGLIIFKQSSDGQVVGGLVELARLKFIVKAQNLGYSMDNINRLIGHAYSVLRSDLPLEKSIEFSAKVSSQLKSELASRDPLEQLNAKCDLRLLTEYIAELKALRDKPARRKVRRQKAQPSCQEQSAGKSDRSLIVNTDRGKAETVSTHGKTRKTAIAAMTAVVLIAIALYFGINSNKISSYFYQNKEDEERRQGQISISGQEFEQDNIDHHFPVPAIEHLPETAVSRTDDSGKNNNSGADSGKTAETHTSQKPGLVQPDPGRTQRLELESLLIPQPLAADIPKPQPLKPLDTEAPGKADKNSEAKPTTALEDATRLPSDSIDLEDFSLEFSPREKVYTASFKIFKNASAISERISGYTFVLLHTISSKVLPMPTVVLHNGKPVSLRKGRFFSIAKLKIQQTSQKLDIDPSEIESATVLVYSRQGSLIKSQLFKTNPRILPVAEKEPVIEKPGRPDAKPSENEDTVVEVKQAKPRNTVTVPGKEALQWERQSYELVVKGKYADVIPAATKAIELAPGSINPYINRSLAYIELGMYKKAIDDCDTALAIDPQSALAYNNRGLSYHRMGEFKKASNDYRKACELGLKLGCTNQHDLETIVKINTLLESSRKAFLAEDWSAVIKNTTAVIKLDPSNAVAYTNRSAAYAENGLFDKALQDSNRALQISPSYALAYNNRGYVYELMGKTKKATADYLKSCSLGLDLGCENLARLEKAP